MTARASMSALIASLRRLINDASGESAVWTDEELQEWLDAHRDEVIEEPLAYAWQTVAGESVVLAYVASCGNWESDAALTDANGDTLTADRENLVVGQWTFDEHQQPPVYLTGRSYDVYAAAADALEARAAQFALAYDFTADGASYHRSQQAQALLALAKQYRRRSRPRVARMVRDDVSAQG
jgi:hypothetical protein